MERIRNHIIDGVEKTCILLGSEDLQPPKHMMQGEKEPGYILIDGKEDLWSWEGLCTIKGQRYVYFDKLALEPFDSIAGAHRDKALDFVRDLAGLLLKHGEAFTSPLVGLVTMWRFYIVDGRGILALPPDLGDLVSTYMSEEERFEGHGAYMRSSTEAGFSLIRQMGQLLYYALTGVKPYGNADVRASGFHEVPLSIYREELFPTLDEKTEGFVSFTLHAKEREQRDIMGNRRADENLAWFLDKSSGLSWDVPSFSTEELAAKATAIASTERVQSLMADIAKKAKRRTFWRQRGAMIGAIAVVAVIVAALSADYLVNLLEPPHTRDMDQVQVIEAFYEAQNDLDVDRLEDALKGCDAPQSTEVINLFVSRQTRLAYEMMDPHIEAADWIAQGRPAIPDTAYVYGITDLEITQTAENQYHVTGSYYTPYPYTEEERVPDEEVEASGKTLTYVYDMWQDFSFEWNNRGWWNITDVSDIHVTFRGVEWIDTYAVTNDMVLGNTSATDVGSESAEVAIDN